ncbi:deoxynucleoside kinase [Patescibacteria group bacterium]|nr:deoxynucleoside kinase [Patescibacteria group bacterium]
MPTKNKRGKFIVIDGSDGSGKKTQWGLLQQRLRQENIPYFPVDFPIYQSFFGKFIKRYLHGDFGDPVKIDPYHASFAYALDRFFYKDKIEQALATGKIVLANRYMESNKIHQGAKFTNRQKLDEYLNWLDKFEFQQLDVPKPNMVLYLHVPTNISQQLIKRRGKIRRIDKHESNVAYQRKVVEVSKYLCRQYRYWHLVDCVVKGELLDRQSIHEMIWQKVKTLCS